MGAIVDRSKVTLKNCLDHARINNSPHDTFVLEMLLKSIKAKADHICQNPFVLEDEDGEPILDEDECEQPLDIPPEVEMWIIRRFAREHQYRMSGNNKINTADISSIDPDDRDWAELVPSIKFD